jgi:2,3,4,5-tetrahydropyridine-2,6-dicarboxylate N-succinyltransferase
MNELKAIIEDAFENRDSISPTSAPEDVKNAVAQAIELLNTGKARVAEKIAGEWIVAREAL